MVEKGKLAKGVLGLLVVRKLLKVGLSVATLAAIVKTLRRPA